MEHDHLEVFVVVVCIPQEVCTPLHAGGCGGDLSPLQGFGGSDPPWLGGLGASGPPVEVLAVVPSKLKTYVKFPCKNIIISSQYRPFIRQMI